MKIGKLLKDNSDKFLPLVLLVMAVAVMQIHAVEFWEEQLGEYTGILMSIALELAAIWLWPKRTWATSGLALLATLLVLSGPLYNTAAPTINKLLAETNKPAMNQELEAVLREDRQRQENSLESDESNSNERSGWSEEIVETREALKGNSSELKALIKDKYSDKSLDLIWLVLMKALALVVMQCVIVLTTRSIFPASEQEQYSEKDTPDSGSNTTDKNAVKKVVKKQATAKRPHVVAA